MNDIDRSKRCGESLNTARAMGVDGGDSEKTESEPELESRSTQDELYSASQSRYERCWGKQEMADRLETFLSAYQFNTSERPEMDGERIFLIIKTSYFERRVLKIKAPVANSGVTSVLRLVTASMGSPLKALLAFVELAVTNGEKRGNKPPRCDSNWPPAGSRTVDGARHPSNSGLHSDGEGSSKTAAGRL